MLLLKPVFQLQGIVSQYIVAVILLVILHDCAALSLTLMKEHILQVFSNVCWGKLELVRE
jgi:hypothetical protein